MNPEDMDCPECGMPADGVMCPTCNVRNFRPFCKQCGKPLSRAARMAVEKAKKDPKVQEAARLLKQIADL
jgi:predicted amidophosphoribosyltransferase